MAWKSTALDTYNMYMEKSAISRRSKFLAYIANWFVLTSYIILPPILVESDDAALSAFKFTPTDLYGFAIGCLVVGYVATVFLCLRHFNNLLFRLESILLPSTTAHFVGVVSCLFNFAGRKGKKALTGNTAVLLSFTIVAFVVFGVMTLHSCRVMARIKHQEKCSRVVSANYGKSPILYTNTFSSTATTATSDFKKAHNQRARKGSCGGSSRKNLLTVLTSSVNPAAQSTSTIATFLDNEDGKKQTNNGNQKNTGESSTQTISKHPSKVSMVEVPTSPTLRTANFAIPVKAPNPAAWKPNATIHSSNSHSRSGSRSGSRGHSRSSSSSAYSMHHMDSLNELAQPIEEANCSTHTLGKSDRTSISSYTTFLPATSRPSSPSSPPPVPTTTVVLPADDKKEKSKSTASKYVPNDVRYLLNEANEVLVGFSQSPPLPSPPLLIGKPNGHLSLAPSKLQSRCGSPHPKSFLNIDAAAAAENLDVRHPSTSQSVFLGELYDCYKYDEGEYTVEFEKLDMTRVDIERATSPRSPRREVFVFPDDVRDSIVSTGSASKARRSASRAATHPKVKRHELERKGSLGSFSGGNTEADRIKEVNLRSPVGSYDGVFI